MRDAYQERSSLDSPEKADTGSSAAQSLLDPFLGESWTEITLADGVKVQECFAKVLKTAQLEHSITMRFSLSAILKGHLYLLSLEADQDGFGWRIKRDVATSNPPPSFENRSIAEFYARNIAGSPYFSGNVLKATTGILTLLDQYGECPSVVQGPGECESQMGRNAYDILAKIQLHEHSLNVAEAILTLVNKGPFIPKAIMAALAHDIGKVPIFREKLYSTGDHPLMGMLVLNDVPGFKYVPYGDEVLNAIKMHHKTPAKDKRTFLDEKLKEADQEARRCEMDGRRWTTRQSCAADSDAPPQDIADVLPAGSKVRSTPPSSRELYLWLQKNLNRMMIENLVNQLNSVDDAQNLASDLSTILNQPAAAFSEMFALVAAAAEHSGTVIPLA